MRKTLFILFGSVAIFFLYTKKIDAKILPRFKNTTGKSTSFSYSSSGILVSARLRADRRAVIVNFSNVQKANSIAYMLIYQTNGQDEGAGGSIVTTDNTTSRELLFGTCSSGVCRYHTNIVNARLEVNYELANGKKYIKRFRIKV